MRRSEGIKLIVRRGGMRVQGNEGGEGDAKELHGGVVVEVVELHDPLPVKVKRE